MIVYIESLKYNNVLSPYNEDAACAYIGYRDKGAEIVLFESVDEVPLNRKVLLVACIETTKEWFKRMEWNINYDFSYPDMYLDDKNVDVYGRKIYKLTRDVLNCIEISVPLFIKPVETKKYEHTIVKNKEELEWYCKNIPYNDKFCISNKINIDSEWRVYVLNKSVLGVRWYNGDFSCTPTMADINKFIKKIPYNTYALDVYVDNEETYIMECNDAWAIGNYGLSAREYTRFLSERWVELLKEN